MRFENAFTHLSYHNGNHSNVDLIVGHRLLFQALHFSMYSMSTLMREIYVVINTHQKMDHHFRTHFYSWASACYSD